MKRCGNSHVVVYVGFEGPYRSDGITEVACLAHMRRKFFDIAQASGSPIAAEEVQRISDLYAVEAEARGKPPDARAAIRRAKARPVFEDLVRWLTSQLQTISGKLDLAKAIRYAVSRYARRGHLPEELAVRRRHRADAHRDREAQQGRSARMAH